MDVGSVSSGTSQISQTSAQMAALMQQAMQAATDQAIKQVEVSIQMQVMQAENDTVGTVVDMYV